MTRRWGLLWSVEADRIIVDVEVIAMRVPAFTHLLCIALTACISMGQPGEGGSVAGGMVVLRD